MRGRRSYRGLMGLPAYGLYDEAGALVATIRAATAFDARDLFRRHGLKGARVKRIIDGHASSRKHLA